MIAEGAIIGLQEILAFVTRFGDRGALLMSLERRAQRRLDLSVSFRAPELAFPQPAQGRRHQVVKLRIGAVADLIAAFMVDERQHVARGFHDLAEALELQFGMAPLGDVEHRHDDMKMAVDVQGPEADLDRELAAIAAPPGQGAILSHRTGGG